MLNIIRRTLKFWQASRRLRTLTRLEHERPLTKLERTEMAEDVKTIKGDPYADRWRTREY